MPISSVNPSYLKHQHFLDEIRESLVPIVYSDASQKAGFQSFNDFPGLVDHQGVHKKQKNAGKPYCMLLTAHRSVSSALAVYPEQRVEILRAASAAAKVAVEQVFQDRIFIRKEGKVVPGELMHAIPMHWKNRNNGPCIHANVVLPRYGRDPLSGKTYSLADTRIFFKKQNEVDLVYQYELAKNLRKLGIDAKLEAGKCKLNVPKELQEVLCNRRDEMIAHLKREGLEPTPEALRIAALITRKDKVSLPFQACVLNWHKEVQQYAPRLHLELSIPQAGGQASALSSGEQKVEAHKAVKEIIQDAIKNDHRAERALVDLLAIEKASQRNFATAEALNSAEQAFQKPQAFGAAPTPNPNILQSQEPRPSLFREFVVGPVKVFWTAAKQQILPSLPNSPKPVREEPPVFKLDVLTGDANAFVKATSKNSRLECHEAARQALLANPFLPSFKAALSFATQVYRAARRPDYVPPKGTVILLENSHLMSPKEIAQFQKTVRQYRLNVNVMPQVHEQQNQQIQQQSQQQDPNKQKRRKP